MKSVSLYPLLFHARCVERFWGGSFVKKECARNFPGKEGKVLGESWEIYDRMEGSSVIENGPLQGYTLHDLVKERSADLLGNDPGYVPDGKTENYFPLIIKLIDTAQRLSLQVHPSLEHCRILGQGEEKNEFWYTLRAGKSSYLYAGLKESITKAQFREALEKDCKSVENLLRTYPVRPEDSYFIPAGKFHAVGADMTLLEIQQNSDTTYRISDWDRVGENQVRRELHIREGMVCMEPVDNTEAFIPRQWENFSGNRMCCLLDQPGLCHIVNLELSEPFCTDTRTGGGFHLISATDHDILVETSSCVVLVEASRTVLIPASVGEYRVTPLQGQGKESHAGILLTTRKKIRLF